MCTLQAQKYICVPKVMYVCTYHTCGSYSTYRFNLKKKNYFRFLCKKKRQVFSQPHQTLTRPSSPFTCQQVQKERSLPPPPPRVPRLLTTPRSIRKRGVSSDALTHQHGQKDLTSFISKEGPATSEELRAEALTLSLI